MTYNKEYYEQNKEKCNRQSSEYIKKHPEKRKEYNDRYYLKHKDNIYENLYKMVRCDCCDKEYKNHYMSKHRKSNKHVNNMRVVAA